MKSWFKKYAVILTAIVMILSQFFAFAMGDLTWVQFASEELVNSIMIVLTGTGFMTLWSGIKDNKWLYNQKTKINSALALVTVVIAYLAGNIPFMEFIQTEPVQWLVAIILQLFTRQSVEEVRNG